jgi:hypothetical protein
LERHHQTVQELLQSLRHIETTWIDEHARQVISAIEQLPDTDAHTESDVRGVLDADFEAGLTVVRLAMEMSKDEFSMALRAQLGGGGIGVKRYSASPDDFVSALEALGVIDRLDSLRATPVSWRDLLIERLKAGRGSAIKGQARGRYLEDFTEEIVKRVFGGDNYDARCRFVGAAGTSTEKTDFAIPSKEEPRILIEVKAYGATGSKQTDILGDFGRIIEEKRHDTHLLLITDGITWHARVNDLRKLVAMQNSGTITRIYTQSMGSDLETDLRQLKSEHGL